ncbi:MAG: hypothetical protein IJ244_07295 [Bacteroidaceae bacterium]|nr:hypothetical protein [Bacteroidaceae bacterium]
MDKKKVSCSTDGSCFGSQVMNFAAKKSKNGPFQSAFANLQNENGPFQSVFANLQNENGPFQFSAKMGNFWSTTSLSGRCSDEMSDFLYY